jgi:hypothetical protein
MGIINEILNSAKTGSLRALLVFALIAGVSLAGLAALRPFFLAMRFTPSYDTLLVGEPPYSASKAPLPPQTARLPVNAAMRETDYYILFKARVSGLQPSCRLLEINPGAQGMGLYALRGGTLAMRAIGGTQLLLPGAFRDGEWFVGTAAKSLGGFMWLEVDKHGDRSSAISALPAEFDTLSVGDPAYAGCSVAGAQITRRTLAYGAPIGAATRYALQTVKILLWLALLLSACGFAARLFWLLMPPATPQPDENARRAGLIALLLLTGFALAVAFHYIEGSYLGSGYPYNTFLFLPDDALNDLFNSLRMSSGLNPYISPEPGSYFPFIYLPLYAVSHLDKALQTLLFLITSLPVFICFNKEYLSRAGFKGTILWQNTLIFSCLSYPMLFCLDRGNLEIYVLLILAAMFYLFEDGRTLWAAACLAIAIALKGSPGIFLLLFARRGHWRAVLLACALSAALVVLPLFVYHGGFAANLAAMRYTMGSFFKYFALDNHDYSHNASLFNLARLCDIFYYALQDRALLLNVFNRVSQALGCVMVYYIWRRKSSLWKQTALLCCATLLFTPVTNDYKLIILFLPLWLFITSEERGRLDSLYAVLFALLLIPKEYPLAHPAQLREAPQLPLMALSIIANPLLMLLLCALIITEDSMPASSRH